MNGDETDVKNAIRNLNVIFNKTQRASGFFNIFGNGYEFKSFGFFEALKFNETFVRLQGDFLYMAQKQMAYLRAMNMEVSEMDGGNKTAGRCLCEAVGRLWPGWTFC